MALSFSLVSVNVNVEPSPSVVNLVDVSISGEYILRYTDTPPGVLG